MFGYAHVFNQDISNWDVITELILNMFKYADSFNQDVGTWDVSNGTDFEHMFHGADSFNQDIGTWDVITELILIICSNMQNHLIKYQYLGCK